jgi:hypothetical protein
MNKINNPALNLIKLIEVLNSIPNFWDFFKGREINYIEKAKNLEAFTLGNTLTYFDSFTDFQNNTVSVGKNLVIGLTTGNYLKGIDGNLYAEIAIDSRNLNLFASQKIFVLVSDIVVNKSSAKKNNNGIYYVGIGLALLFLLSENKN